MFYDQGEKRLTGTETALLSYLVDRSPDIISREELYREVWEHSVSLQTRTLDLAVLRLRKKIEADPKDPVHILNVYGKGYCFVPSGGQTGSFRPVASTKPHSNLELEGNVFVGRKDELKQLDELVSGGSRLTTILGPGGTGKTRLARHWASGQLGAGSIGGVFFCDITEARDLPCLLRIVTTVLGLEVTGRAEDSSQLVREIREELQKLSKPLVIFDNAEQVVAELRLMLQVLMGEESESLFIVTSQVALGLPSEQRFPLGPLPAPSQDSSELKHCPSIELFVERARLIRPDFELTKDNQAIIASIVTELDCLPLAIELAAARVGMMTPATIRKRLDERFRLLRQTHTDGSGKHHTLEAALRWSWDLLGEDEQSALAQCAVFRGGFDWEAAEAVIEVMPGGGSPWPVDLIAALVEHSLVIVRQDHAQKNRLSLLTSVSAFAAQKLKERDKDREQGAERRHALHYAGLRQAKRSINYVPEGALAQLDREVENVRAALERSLKEVWDDTAVDCCWSLMATLWQHGLLVDSIDAGRSILSLELPPERRLEVLLNLGWLASNGGRFEEAEQAYLEAEPLAANIGDLTEHGRATHGLGTLQNRLGKYSDAIRNFTEAVRIAEGLGLARNASVSLTGLGNAYLELGQWDEARESYERSIHLVQGGRDKITEAGSLFNLGRLLHRQEDRSGAKKLYLRAKRMLGQPSDQVVLFTSILGQLGLLEAELDHFPSASQYIDEARAILSATDYRPALIELICLESQVAHLRGEPASAAALFLEAEDMLQSLRLANGGGIQRRVDELRELINLPAP